MHINCVVALFEKILCVYWIFEQSLFCIQANETVLILYGTTNFQYIDFWNGVEKAGYNDSLLSEIHADMALFNNVLSLLKTLMYCISLYITYIIIYNI